MPKRKLPAGSLSLSEYRDKKFKGTGKQLVDRLVTSKTLYVGNLSFYTTEEQIHELFSMCGVVKRVIMGLNKRTYTPCGFCFIEYHARSAAEHCMLYLNKTRLDDRVIRIDWDAGFEEGRQYGRGLTGGQVRDEFREDFDKDRGGFGKNSEREAIRSHQGRPFRRGVRRRLPAGNGDAGDRRAPYRPATSGMDVDGPSQPGRAQPTRRPADDFVSSEVAWSPAPPASVVSIHSTMSPAPVSPLVANDPASAESWDD